MEISFDTEKFEKVWQRVIKSDEKPSTEQEKVQNNKLLDEFIDMEFEGYLRYREILKGRGGKPAFILEKAEKAKLSILKALQGEYLLKTGDVKRVPVFPRFFDKRENTPLYLLKTEKNEAERYDKASSNANLPWQRELFEKAASEKRKLARLLLEII